ncbi:TPA: helix-turn-helix domain-containing protein, partial [Enterobacter hormaechei subsp. steigerwaltii]|nr:helix-turn-helix domain-containing protein [Enterobacter hormaechei subsp. steigerwaltii]HAS0899077.1 helix-turn-helix domain-containing protein [Enterobacter hormaechei subsp. steigerwaltii]HAT7683764.1 helix-turn-helix domain-containing protein [Enterobacter hormaechei subsp. steigerwaltii]HAV1004822.1 helix-turn-helix domain-containing protein [Enterobacter hormaechei subsp. steigerwaltii]
GSDHRFRFLRCPLHQKGTGATEIAHQLSIARSTVYKILEDERAS